MLAAQADGAGAEVGAGAAQEAVGEGDEQGGARDGQAAPRHCSADEEAETARGARQRSAGEAGAEQVSPGGGLGDARCDACLSSLPACFSISRLSFESLLTT